MSHSVIVGFTAANLLLVLDQAKNLLGVAARGGPHDLTSTMLAVKHACELAGERCATCPNRKEA